MGIYEEDEEDFDLKGGDYETLEELDVDENGHVVEGRRKRYSREEEYEPDFDYESSHPEAYGYDNAEDEDD